jgi:hypothetical protein
MMAFEINFGWKNKYYSEHNFKVWFMEIMRSSEVLRKNWYALLDSGNCFPWKLIVLCNPQGGRLFSEDIIKYCNFWVIIFVNIYLPVNVFFRNIWMRWNLPVLNFRTKDKFHGKLSRDNLRRGNYLQRQPKTTLKFGKQFLKNIMEDFCLRVFEKPTISVF